MNAETALKRLISMHGPLTVAQFMAECLGHPEYGYYMTRDPIGKEGDFTTAPEVSQLFGEMLGIWCAWQWQQMGSPKNILWMELGPGRGTLMHDMLRATKHITGFHQALTVYMVESSPVLTAKQQQALASVDVPVSWHKAIPTLPSLPLLLTANEFFDALPVHQYVLTREGWRERMVSLTEEGELTFILSGKSALHSSLIERYPDAGAGSIIEICPAAEQITHHLAGHIKAHKGAAILVDYGYNEPHSYQETLQAVKTHHYHPVLKTPGEADLTTHVNFSALIRAIEPLALHMAYTSQGHFLSSMGIEERAKQLRLRAKPSLHAQIEQGLKRLIQPEAMGELFKVLMFWQL